MNLGLHQLLETWRTNHRINWIPHESHHRVSILLTLKECGHNLNQEARNAIWGWDRM